MDATMLQPLRELILEIGGLLYQRGYVVSNDGNISVRTGENTILITPAGVSKARMQPDMLALCDLNGNLLTGPRQPSSEIKMHLAVYRNRPDVAAVLHAHSPISTAFAVCRRAIEKRYLPELLVGLGRVPVAEFAIPSTEEVPQSILPYVQDHQAVLIANHGVLVWNGGLPPQAWQQENALSLITNDLWACFDKLEVIEYAAKMELHAALLGGGVEIEEEALSKLYQLRGFYRERAKELQ